jgi:UDP-N-acetylglucosamine--N-acetylmuramyl-(pentapeptide) pyrophosphoryl-undecaprenol N-acetylglucosamine transferase
MPFRAVEAAPVRGTTPWTLGRNLIRLLQGYRQASQLLDEWEADVAIVTGAYVSVPTALAAHTHRVPFMIYLPDREPGLAVRFLSRYADGIAVSFEEFRDSFPSSLRHKVWVSGYPVRAALLSADREAGLRELKLDPGLRTLLALGGSRGARALNRALVAILPDLLECCQVIHVSGQLDWQWVKEMHDALPEGIKARYQVYAYLHRELPAAMAAADLAVARAGAATMAEFPVSGLPSVLVPYPYAGQHQKLNADFMVSHGAAVRLDEADLESQLKPTVLGLLRDGSTLERMSQQARALAKPDASFRLAAELHRLACGGEGKLGWSYR